MSEPKEPTYYEQREVTKIASELFELIGYKGDIEFNKIYDVQGIMFRVMSERLYAERSRGYDLGYKNAMAVAKLQDEEEKDEAEFAKDAEKKEARMRSAAPLYYNIR